MDCKNSILEETFGQHLAASPSQIALQLMAILERVNTQDERINDLEATNAALVARLDVLEAAATEEVQSPQQVTQPPDIAILGEILQLRADVEEFNESRALEIAEDRGRLRALEVPEVASPTMKTTGHLDRLDMEMRGSRIRQLSFTNAARLLVLSSSRLRQLKPLIAEDRRFTIVKDPHHSQRLLIRTNFRM